MFFCKLFVCYIFNILIFKIFYDKFGLKLSKIDIYIILCLLNDYINVYFVVFGLVEVNIGGV